MSEGENGFVCLVMRGWSAPTYTPAQFRDLVYEPTVRAPICFDPIAAETVLPYYALRTQLGMAGKTPDQIAAGVESAYATGVLPQRIGVSFAYMWSADQNLIPGVGAWHPHVMVFAPYYENATIGGNDFGSPLPQVTDDAGTPFTVVVIPVDHDLASGPRHSRPAPMSWRRSRVSSVGAGVESRLTPPVTQEKRDETGYGSLQSQTRVRGAQ